jgi:hypothetical protein
MRPKVVVRVLALVVLIFGSAVRTSACGCGSANEKSSMTEIANQALNNATAVFSGKVVRFEWLERKAGVSRLSKENRVWKTKVAIIEVDRWWKLSLPAEISLFTDEVIYTNGNGGNSSCNYNFVDGTSYLVFANGPKTELRANKCAPTNPIELVSGEFLAALGEGNVPAKKRSSPKRRI